MQLELIETDVCQHLTMRAMNDFFHSEHLYQPGNVPIYIFLGILDDTNDDCVNYATRACFTSLQSNHMRKQRSFYVDADRSVCGGHSFLYFGYI